MSRYQLVVIESKRPLDVGATFPLEVGVPLDIGRAAESAILLASPFVARYHARATLEPDGTLRLADRGSDNGTFVDGEWVRFERVLEAGQRFSIVDVAVFEFRRVP